LQDYGKNQFRACTVRLASEQEILEMLVFIKKTGMFAVFPENGSGDPTATKRTRE
jgi:hypothetical protein